MKMTILDRLLLLITGLLAAWQVAVGINGLDAAPTLAYTIGFGVLLVASLLLIILGFEALDSPIVVIFSTLIPLSLALGLAWEFLPALRTAYLIFTILGFLAILGTRVWPIKNRLPVLILAMVHGIAGLTIFVLPILVVIQRSAPTGMLWISLGGMLIGVGGILLALLKTGKPLMTRKALLNMLPALLLCMTAAFVAGFSAIH